MMPFNRLKEPYRYLLLLTLFHVVSNDMKGQSVLEPAFPALRFTQPVDLQHAGDGSNRLFVVEQAGRIKVFEASEAVTSASVFLDISNRISSGGERGLLGLAFHPTFEQNGTFFINYTVSGPLRTRVSRMRVDPLDPNRALPGSEEVLMEFGQPYSNHNGGGLGFGPDGYLYIGTGDGGSAGDPDGWAQNRASFFGKILRIDVDATSQGLPYSIPADNPFAGNALGFREEIYAYGLRNPWRFSFDPVTGNLWVGDVGQNSLEEISIIKSGGNYGWRTMEGTRCYSPASGCNTSNLILPVWAYGRSEGRSVTGGFVYRGTRRLDLAGRYVYGDYETGRIWALTYDGTPSAASVTALAQTGMSIASFGTDEAGELYVVDRGGGLYQFAAVSTDTTQDLVTRFDARIRLESAYPNPFRSTHYVSYLLEEGGQVEVDIYDATGRRIRHLFQGTQPAGRHRLLWNAEDEDGIVVAGGLYFIQLRVDRQYVITQGVVYTH